MAITALYTLVDQNLLQRDEFNGEPRFTLLETIREFAAEWLADAVRGNTLLIIGPLPSAPNPS